MTDQPKASSASATKYLCVVEKGTRPSKHCHADSVTAELGIDIVLNAKVLDGLDQQACQPVHYDLLILCASIEFADRRWQRSRSSWSRSLNLTVPVIALAHWQKPEVVKKLQHVLSHLTGDRWQFNFVQAKDSSPLSWRQIPIALPKTVTFAIAYSDGLDSRAVAGLVGQNEEALRIRVSRTRERSKNGEVFFTQIPFKVNSRPNRESSFRSRGFKFAALTAIAAHLTKLTRVIVPESGQGALGPVLLPLYQTYADYRNHPTFFRKMESFLQELLGYSVQFDQPRLWSTKGQTLRAFLETGKDAGDLIDTRSCWQSRRVVNRGTRKQCGLCAACLLRRLSMHVAGVSEPPETYVITDLSARSVAEALSSITEKSDRDMMVEYGSVGCRYLDRLAGMASLPDDGLRVHVSEIAAATHSDHFVALAKLRSLLNAHAAEWSAFLSAQGEQSFLNHWTTGGLHA